MKSYRTFLISFFVLVSQLYGVEQNSSEKPPYSPESRIVKDLYPNMEMGQKGKPKRTSIGRDQVETVDPRRMGEQRQIQKPKIDYATAKTRTVKGLVRQDISHHLRKLRIAGFSRGSDAT